MKALPTDKLMDLGMVLAAFGRPDTEQNRHNLRRQLKRQGVPMLKLGRSLLVNACDLAAALKVVA